MFFRLLYPKKTNNFHRFSEVKEKLEMAFIEKEKRQKKRIERAFEENNENQLIF